MQVSCWGESLCYLADHGDGAPAKEQLFHEEPVWRRPELTVFLLSLTLQVCLFINVSGFVATTFMKEQG